MNLRAIPKAQYRRATFMRVSNFVQKSFYSYREGIIARATQFKVKQRKRK